MWRVLIGGGGAHPGVMYTVMGGVDGVKSEKKEDQ